MRILLVRTSALGDIVHALPVLTALRRHLPKARIGWVVEEPFVPLLARHPDLDLLLPVRLRTWRKRPFHPRTLKEIGRFLMDLNEFSADVVLDLMGNHKAGVLAAMTLADRRIGLARAFRREPSSAMWLTEWVQPEGPHAVDRMLVLLDALGIPREPPEFDGEKLDLDPPLEAAEFFERSPEPRLLIHPGAGWANKRYPPERWGEVARALAENPGYRSWIAAGPGEESLAQEVAAASRGTAEAVSAFSLGFFAELARRAPLVLGGDTGPVHLAHALGRSVLCVLGPTGPERNGPWGEPERSIYKRLSCSFCHRRFDESKGCLLSLETSAVIERAQWLIALTPDENRC